MTAEQKQKLEKTIMSVIAKTSAVSRTTCAFCKREPTAERGRLKTSPAQTSFQIIAEMLFTPELTAGKERGICKKRSFCVLESEKQSAISKSFFRSASFTENPALTESVMTGSVISTATNTGTEDDFSQKSARSIIETTGTARTSDKSGSKKVSTEGKNAKQSPRTKPKKAEMKNESAQREKVATNAEANFFVENV